MVNNGRENNGKLTLSGATPSLILNNNNGAFNMGGFSSTADINTLLSAGGTSLSAEDTLIFSVVVDSIGGKGELRSRGFEFGVSEEASFVERETKGRHLVLQLEPAKHGSDVSIIPQSFQDVGGRGFDVKQASLEDGFSVTLTVNSMGYIFLLEDIVVANGGAQNGNKTATITGTFTGNEFIDNFSRAHYYLAAQKFNNGNLTLNIRESKIVTIPELSVSALIVGVTGLLFVIRRRPRAHALSLGDTVADALITKSQKSF